MNSARTGILGILLLIVGIFLIFVLLNYFNILSLSKLYPDQLDFLPRQNIQEAQTSSETSDNSKIVCPIEESYCEKGTIISLPNTNPTIYSIVYKTAPARSLLYSVISGKYKTNLITEANGAPATLVNITDDKKGISATYVFKGDSMPASQAAKIIDQKQVIGSLSGEKLSKELFGGPYALVISIKDLKNNVFLQTKPQ